jgi:hypothetical protein
MTKLLEDALKAVRNLPADEQDNIARAVLRMTGTDDEPPVAPPRNPPPRAANLPATNRYVPCGPNTGCEPPLHPSGTCRS